MLTECVGMWRERPTFRATMPFPRVRVFTAALGAAMVMLFAVPGASLAQAPEAKPPDKPAAGDGKEIQKKIDEFAEAEKFLAGPAANPECLWLGRRVVSLLWRDDLETAFRHLDLYDRFGCPGDHIQAAFRCLVRQGDLDGKATDKLYSRVHACWLSPNGESRGTAAAPGTTTDR
jgi:hypothetical protein